MQCLYGIAIAGAWREAGQIIGFEIVVLAGADDQTVHGLGFLKFKNQPGCFIAIVWGFGSPSICAELTVVCEKHFAPNLGH